MKKVMFKEAERWTNGIYQCFEVLEDGVKPIPREECYKFINQNNVKCLCRNDQGYIVYGICK